MPSLPAVPGYKARVFVDGADLSAQSSGIVISGDIETSDYFVMANPVKQNVIIGPAISISHTGYYTGRGTGEYFEKFMYDRVDGVSDVVIVAALDAYFYALNLTWGSQLNINAQVADLITIEGNWSSSKNKYRGATVYAGSASNAYTSPNIDMGAAFAAGTIILSAGGYNDLTGVSGNVTVIVETSTNGSTGWTLLKQQAFVAPGVVVVTHTGGNQYARLRVTTTNYADSADVFGGIVLQSS